MLWQDDEPQKEAAIEQTIVDMVFDMNCRCLPVDHAYALSQAISKALPWFEQEPQAGLLLIHGAESGNGWIRPDEQDDLLYLSRRTKLTLRLPQHRLAEAKTLSGMTLDIGGYSLKVGAAKEKPLSQMPVLFARHIVANPQQDEDAFLDTVVAQLQKMGIQCRKALCGRSHRFKLPDGDLFTRSLMIADLAPQDSMTLQERGLGEGRKMGCGLFVPHKDIKSMNPDAEK
ncbi:MAG TPA: type I-MYXAN CRISPR-associated protein Cas6/Cmx6 [Thioploca sp.]|nr:MAG: type I-MYXAN CRISPR-associated protein Cas6/Cmx6 [Beggiatoa sp. 4572_84]RKZ63177.1 MAG: type I-MYXAN CRISPR-associated protein Cas6/Cmx6 [Gammaproteobacteria bacterium]HDN26608.1 type I-MYXAN CRISPR-associated protein Cas6/Cmx6 [Thioploca sp.]